MNTETNKDETAEVSMTTGERLRQAREQLGLSQRVVAERLCLMLSTVRDIEEDKLSPDLATTFVRGYIRSYAKLVHIPEEELLPLSTSQSPTKVVKSVAPMQSFSMTKKRKKRDGWLMIFTFLVLFVVVGLTGAWWWQNHKVQQQEIEEMVDQSSARLSESGQQVDLGAHSAPETVNETSTATPTTGNGAEQAAAPVEGSAVPGNTPATEPGSAPNNVQNNIQNNDFSLNAAAIQAQLPPDALNSGSAPAAANSSTGLVMTFSGDCWVTVRDATGKTLTSALQQKDSTLTLEGTAPYKVTLGVPSVVSVQYQGNSIDLSAFAKSSRVARLTIPKQ